GAAGVRTRAAWAVAAAAWCVCAAAGCKGRAASTAPAPAGATGATATGATAPGEAAKPVDATALYQAGKTALAGKRLREAVDAFTRATTLADDAELKANAWLGLGASYAELGDHAHALAAYEQVTVLRPDDADAWRVLAEGLAAAGKRERQAGALEHVIALDPDDLSAYLDLAG